MKEKSPAVIFSLFVFCITCLPQAASTQEMPKDWGAQQGDDMLLLNKEQEKSLDSVQENASKKLLSAAEWIDSFFDDDRSTTEENKTRATVKLSMGYSRNDSFEIKPRFDLRLKLPKLSSRANLFIQAAEDQDFNFDSDPLGDRPGNDDGDKNQLTAGLRFFLKESEKYNITFDTGASWNYLFAGVRYRAAQDFGTWQGRFTNRLRYYTDDGYENKASYDLERQFSEKLMFRTTTSVNILEEEDGIPHSQYFRLYQVLSPYQAISYESGVYLGTDPSYKVTDTQVLVKYRQRFYRDWLVLEVSPKITFPEDHDRDPNPGIVFKLEATLGYDSDVEGYNKIFR